MASKKGRESEGKREKARTAERLAPKIFINDQEFSTMSCLGAFIAKPNTITKNYKSKHYYKEKVGRKPKREQKVKKSNGQQEQSTGLKT